MGGAGFPEVVGYSEGGGCWVCRAAGFGAGVVAGDYG